MRIAVIGAGSVGGALAGAARSVGHDVVVAATSHAKAQDVAAGLGVEAAASPRDAVRHADAVVLAVPFRSVCELAEELSDALDGKIVVDVTNPLAPNLTGLATGEISGAEMIQERAPGARVVKAFNTIFAEKQADPTADGTAFDGLVAGDDPAAKAAVLELTEAIGYRPMDAGTLSAARYLEGMAFLNIWLNVQNGWGRRTGWRLMGAGD
jgi:hypothetical protein